MALGDLIPWKKRKGDIRIRREYEDIVDSFRREVDRLFDRVFRGYEIEPFTPAGAYIREFTPDIDVVENDKEVKITAELPGIDEKDIDITIADDMLTIKGEKKEETEDKGKDYYRMERRYGSFLRTIPLPTEIDESKVEAKFNKGVLTVRLPKSQEAIKGRKKIEVKNA